MTIYIWHTGHQINDTLSQALHAGIPDSVLKHISWKDNYFNQNNKHVAIGYGILRGTGDVFHHNFNHNVDYWEVDRGYINPGHFDGYYRISKNGMQAKYVDKDLPSDRLDKLKFKRDNWFNPKGKIIVCPPSDFIEKYDNLPTDWLDSATRYLKERDIPFKVRHKSDTIPLEHDLQGASLVVTYNSNVAIDAIIKGIPIKTSNKSIAYGWAGNTIDPLLQNTTPPTDEQVDKLLRFISYNQFTLEEIRNGTAWRLLHA